MRYSRLASVPKCLVFLIVTLFCTHTHHRTRARPRVSWHFLHQAWGMETNREGNCLLELSMLTAWMTVLVM